MTALIAGIWAACSFGALGILPFLFRWVEHEENQR